MIGGERWEGGNGRRVMVEKLWERSIGRGVMGEE